VYKYIELKDWDTDTLSPSLHQIFCSGYYCGANVLATPLLLTTTVIAERQEIFYLWNV
jgi:hypothetical protein